MSLGKNILTSYVCSEGAFKRTSTSNPVTVVWPGGRADKATNMSLEPSLQPYPIFPLKSGSNNTNARDPQSALDRMKAAAAASSRAATAPILPGELPPANRWQMAFKEEDCLL